MTKVSAPRLALGFYLAVLLIPVLVTPLWISEILQLFGTTRPFPVMLRWVSATPATAPLGYIEQFPFVSILGPSSLAARSPTMLFALGSGLLFWRLAMRVRLQRPFAALLFFLFIPIHFQFASEGRPFEAALFLTLSASLLFFRLVDEPGAWPAILYALVLTACLYTEPFSILPAVGYALFLLLFIKQIDKRRAMWFVLPATAVPIVLFLPYYFSSHARTVARWLYGPEYYVFNASTASVLVRDLSARHWSGYILSVFLLMGAAVACWRAFQLAPSLMSKRVQLVCLAGGVLSTVGLSIAADLSTNSIASASRCLWALPALIVLFSASLDWVSQTVKLPLVSTGLTVAMLAFCVTGDIGYIGSNPDDYRKTADLIGPELAGDACLVFVSEGLSRTLFVTFRPELANRECFNFSHKRIVLVVHPLVTPEQQEDAHSAFLGLNYTDTKQVAMGRNKLIVMDQKK